MLAILCKLTADGTNYLKPSKAWYFKVRRPDGTVVTVNGPSDLKAAEHLAAETERTAARRAVGLTAALDDHARRPLAEHLADYESHLRANGGTPAHVDLTAARCRARFAGCRFATPADIDAGRAADWLAALRRDGEPAAVPPGDAFTPARAAVGRLGLANAAVDVRRARRELTAAEMAAVSAAARESGRTFRGLAALTPADFALGELTRR